ncbi:hypothetical protein GIB67_014674 [Kingdonia uniflora]|uniref:O-fucosyltransferase family protein n=1 Tax=Kingdonia uniflora TaxID=39325 RepID=A0A7J7LY65_9MAGN|nr:hypothetical protein GIB67_014674 [Kingdonia uniflora]
MKNCKGSRGLEGDYLWKKSAILHELKNGNAQFGVFKGSYGGKRHVWGHRKNARVIGFVFVSMSFLFLLDSIMFSVIRSMSNHNRPALGNSNGSEDERSGYVNEEQTQVQTPVVLYGRLLSLASSSLAEKEFKRGSFAPWEEPYKQVSVWKPCADKPIPIAQEEHTNSTGFILVSANGGLNQQRVAVCNAVAVASLLNATLVLPKFLYSNVWKDPSQFEDIYQMEYFMNLLKDDVNMVKDLPSHLQTLDIEAIGSLVCSFLVYYLIPDILHTWHPSLSSKLSSLSTQITDADIEKEAKSVDFLKVVHPILLKNEIVHFLGFGNRLGFDPLSSKLQRLRCKCNFHALKFVPKIQQAGSLLIQRLRKYGAARSLLDKQLLGDFMPDIPMKGVSFSGESPKYVALHLRFELDMVAYSLCDFGGGEIETKELQAYREIHFSILAERLRNTKSVSPEELRKSGKCPLSPEEAGLVLSSLGFKRGTYVYLAGSHIYGGEYRMHPFTSLYPNVVTKEDLLTPSELAPFRNFSSQLAALDFIACATADVFAMTDSGSQLSSLVSGYRVYYGGGQAPTLSPNKKRLAAILSENSTMRWKDFEGRVRKMIVESQRVRVRGIGRSIYRQPRCADCMCKGH